MNQVLISLDLGDGQDLDWIPPSSQPHLNCLIRIVRQNQMPGCRQSLNHSRKLGESSPESVEDNQFGVGPIDGLDGLGDQAPRLFQVGRLLAVKHSGHRDEVVGSVHVQLHILEFQNKGACLKFPHPWRP